MIIFTAIYGGWATPTEAGALGAFVVLVGAFFGAPVFAGAAPPQAMRSGEICVT